MLYFFEPKSIRSACINISCVLLGHLFIGFSELYKNIEVTWDESICDKSKPAVQNFIQREWFVEPLEHIQVSSSGSHCRFWCVGFVVVSVFESGLSVSIVSVTSVPSPLGPSVSESSQGFCSASHLHLFSSKYAKSVLNYIWDENQLLSWIDSW